PFSTAGKRLSIQDERASGFDLMFAAIKKLTPRFFVIENVPGVLSAAQKHRPLAERGPGFPQLRSNEQYGSAFQEILKELGTLCCEKGYCATWGILNSADYGVPQKRLRLVIIGSLDGFSLWPEQTHSNLPSGSLLNWVSLKEAIGDLKETTPLFKGFNEQTKEFLELIPQGGNWRNLPECSKEQAMGKAFKSWGGRSGFLRRLSWNEPSPTITSSPMGRATLMCHPVENRPLTVRECARIQGFPDSWNFSGSVTEQYQQIGNATPVGLGLAIGRALRIDNLNLEQNLYAGEVFCAQPELISKLGKRPRTKLNPFSMRPGANRESDLEWLGLSATVRTDAKEFKLRP
ncbi:MAG: DNA cytosine methyltransferase, partial [Proteobacteria bacterium]